MNKTIVPLFAFIAILSYACTSNTSPSTNSLEEEKWKTVMANHDVIMPMMGSINQVRKGLKSIYKESEDLSAENKEKITELINHLDQADEAMMDWMNAFQSLKNLRADKSHEAIIQYLEEEEKRITKVGKDMTSSIEAGNKFLEKFSR